jgi:predicted esterase
MTAKPIAIAAALLAITAGARAEVTSEKHSVEGQDKQQYFLIRDAGAKPPKSGSKLLLVLPGGDGSAAFNPFITNIAKHAIGEGYTVAQLISVKWTPTQSIIWPTESSKVDGMKFTTEDFIGAVIDDVEKTHEIKLDPEHIYTLTWSSSGPAAYAASLSVERLKGSFVAMSVYKSRAMRDIKKAKGHRYYIYHSPDDKVCPLALAEKAKESLADAGATVEFQTYAGGHGWHGDIFGAIRTGIGWLEKR